MGRQGPGCCAAAATESNARILLGVLCGDSAELWRLALLILGELIAWRPARAFVVREQVTFQERLTAILTNPGSSEALRREVHRVWSDLATWIRVDALIDRKVVVRRGPSSPRTPRRAGSQAQNSSEDEPGSGSGSGGGGNASGGGSAAGVVGGSPAEDSNDATAAATRARSNSGLAARRHRSGTVVLPSTPTKSDELRRKVAMQRAQLGPDA
jgi:hypothetical protein